MRTRRLLAVLGVPVFAMACAEGSTTVGGPGDSGAGGGAADANYGADDAGVSTTSDSGSTRIDSGSTTTIDSGAGGGGAPLITDGGDCIGDPQAPIGYDFACELALDFNTDSPCTPGMNQCAAAQCCYTDPAAMCYADYPEAGTQCVPLAGM